MAVRWTYIDPATVFNPFIGFQTVLIALIGGAATLWGPLIAAVVFSLLAETLRLQLPQVYMMALGVLLILCVLYLRAAWPRCAGPCASRPRRCNATARCSRRAGHGALRRADFGASTPSSAAFAPPANWWASSVPTAPARRPSSTRISGVHGADLGRAASRAAGDLTGKAPHRFARMRLARTFQTPRVFADMPVSTTSSSACSSPGAGRAGCRALPGHCASASILDLIGARRAAPLPAAAITPSQQRLLEIGMALATRPSCCCSTKWRRG